MHCKYLFPLYILFSNFAYIVSAGLFYVNLVMAGNYASQNLSLDKVLSEDYSKEKFIHDLEGKSEAEAIILGGPS